MVQAFFGLLNFLIPAQIPYWFGVFFSYAQLGSGLFPMADILLALASVIAVWVSLYSVKIVLWGIRVIPFIGNLGFLPQHTTVTTSSAQSQTMTTFDSKGNPHTTNRILTNKGNTTTTKRRRWM